MLETSVCDPLEKVPKIFEYDSKKDLGLNNFTKIWFFHSMKFQKHPNKFIVGFQKSSHFEEDDIVICLSDFSYFSNLFVHACEWIFFVVLGFYLLLAYFLL